jgi:hypothetical protein
MLNFLIISVFRKKKRNKSGLFNQASFFLKSTSGGYETITSECSDIIKTNYSGSV